MNNDILIISVTMLVGFTVFVGVIFVLALLFPRVKSSVEKYYKRKAIRETLPGNLLNTHSFAEESKQRRGSIQ